MKRLCAWLIVAAAMLAPLGGALAAVTASLDRTQVAPGESVRLTLIHDGGGDADLGPLDRDFDVLGRSSGTSVQIVNGRISTTHQLQLTLIPKRSGRLTVPPLRWGSDMSAPLTLDVGVAPSGAAATAPPVFLTTQLDTPRPYVQSSAVLTVQLHADVPLGQASLDLQGSADVRVQPLGKDQQSTETRDGRTYQVITRRYVLLPQRSGSLRLDGPVLDAQVAQRRPADPFFGTFPGLVGATRPLRLHGDPIVLQVRPRPPGIGGGNWLPAQQLQLSQSWNPSGDTVHVGDPLTRQLRVRAVGLDAAQLPDLSASLVLPEGVKAYPDQAKLTRDEQSGQLVGERDQAVALIASRPGTISFPELRVNWWDTAQDVAREAVLPAHTVQVLPAVGNAAAPPAMAASASTAVAAPAQRPASAARPAGPLPTARALPWPWISALLAALWLGTLLAWWWRTRRRGGAARVEPAGSVAPARRIGPSEARRRFVQACRDNAAPQARRWLLAWARERWPDAPPVGLQALGERLGQASLMQALRELDRACFNAADWDGAALLQAFDSLPAAAAPPVRDSPLPDQLYPNPGG